MYIEGLKQGAGKQFIKLSKELISKGKKIIALKSGKTGAGTKAVSSHTASMAGDYEVYYYAFRQAGIIEAKTMEDLMIYIKTISYYEDI